MWWLALLGCGGDCTVDAPLDYAEDAHWLCRPGLDGACPQQLTLTEVAEDGTLSPRTLDRAEAPGLACFAVYPTLDLRLRADLDHDGDATARAAAWAREQLAPFGTVCDLWVPVYRQVSIGTYAGRRTPHKEACHAAALHDVQAAFDAFLAAEPDRPFALIGHSQGGQRVAELVRERIEGDPALLARLVAVYPIGWPVADSSFERVPPCTDASQTGCAVGYRSVIGSGRVDDGGAYAEGEPLLCTHPASPDDPQATATLAGLLMSADNQVLDRRPTGVGEDAVLVWPEAFTATCRPDGNRALEVRWAREDRAPFNLGGLDVRANGAHVIDLNLGALDLAEDLRRRAGP